MDEAKRGQKGGDDDNSSGREGLHETARVPEMTQRNELFEVDRINCRNEDGSILLPESFVPSTYDCIVGWARQNHRWPGNERFRQLVHLNAQSYHSAKTKQEKTAVIARVVHEVRQGSPTGAGFVKKEFYSDRWAKLLDEKAKDKVGHAIRKAAEELARGNSHSRHRINQHSNLLPRPTPTTSTTDHATFPDFQQNMGTVSVPPVGSDRTGPGSNRVDFPGTSLSPLSATRIDRDSLRRPSHSVGSSALFPIAQYQFAGLMRGEAANLAAGGAIASTTSSNLTGSSIPPPIPFTAGSRHWQVQNYQNMLRDNPSTLLYLQRMYQQGILSSLVPFQMLRSNGQQSSNHRGPSQQNRNQNRSPSVTNNHRLALPRLPPNLNVHNRLQIPNSIAGDPLTALSGLRNAGNFPSRGDLLRMINSDNESILRYQVGSRISSGRPDEDDALIRQDETVGSQEEETKTRDSSYDIDKKRRVGAIMQDAEGLGDNQQRKRKKKKKKSGRER